MTLVHSTSRRSASLLACLAFGLGVALFAAFPGCSSDDAAPATDTDGGAGSASTGSAGSGGAAGAAGGMALCAKSQMASDPGDHCVVDGGMIKQAADMCPTTPGAAQADDGGEETYPDPHSGTNADDDDCKYDVAYGIVPCDHSGLTTLTVNLKSRVTGMPVTGAAPSIEAFLDDTHPLPNSPKPVMTEVGNGDYKIAGVPFDMAGFWTVRFHFFEMCLESDDTKHGHIAFTVILE